MQKITFVTMTRLNRALRRVELELKEHGLWNEKLDKIQVHLVPIGVAYGWQMYRSSGEICIPAVSVLRLQDWLYGGYHPVADVLRHEYAHALADTHRGLMRSRQFRRAFGTHHDDEDEWDFDPACHVTEYASTDASEDFAESFMLYLRHNGRLPPWHATPAIRAKWRFIRRLCRLVKYGARKARGNTA